MFLFDRRFLAALSFLLNVPAGAQQTLTLVEAQQLAVARSRQIASTGASAASARAMAVAAGQLPDPVLKLGVDNLPVNGPDRFSLTHDFMTMRRIGVMQELTSSDKRRLRSERAERDVQRAEADRQMAVADIQRETALAWIDRLYAQSMLELARAQVTRAELQVQAADVAFRGARGSQADVFAARAASVSAQDKVRQLERQAGAADVSLVRWTGPEAQSRAVAGGVNWRDPQLEQVVSAEHLRTHPRLVVLEAQLQAARTEVQQAQANTRPDWTVEAGYSQRGPAYSNMISVGVSIPLQIDRPQRQDREVAAKLAAAEEVQAKLEEALREEESKAKVLLNDWKSGVQRLELLTRDLLPAARNRTEAALAVYRAGKGDLGATLSAQREETDARLQVLALEMEVARLWAQLKFLAPDPVAMAH